MFSLERKDYIPKAEVIVETSRSSGAGGQNINKRETKVALRWSIENSSVLTATEKAKISERLKNKINNNRELLVVCQTERTQEGNLAKAWQKLESLVNNALLEDKERKATKPPLHKIREIKKRTAYLKEKNKEVRD